eukprot:4573538-Pleurochrysis_carterae.AAC.3
MVWYEPGDNLGPELLREFELSLAAVCLSSSGRGIYRGGRGAYRLRGGGAHAGRVILSDWRLRTDP